MALPSPSESGVCTMESCFDYSRCPLLSEFSFFTDSSVPANCRSSSLNNIITGLQTSPYRTTSSTKACLFIMPVCSKEDVNVIQSSENWQGDGRNHLLVFDEDVSLEKLGNLGRSMFSASEIPHRRSGFDVVLKTNWEPLDLGNGDVLAALPPQVRKQRIDSDVTC